MGRRVCRITAPFLERLLRQGTEKRFPVDAPDDLVIVDVRMSLKVERTVEVLLESATWPGGDHATLETAEPVCLNYRKSVDEMARDVECRPLAFLTERIRRGEGEVVFCLSEPGGFIRLWLHGNGYASPIAIGDDATSVLEKAEQLIRAHRREPTKGDS